MNHTSQVKRVCNSWYHHRGFRILLFLVGLDMFILGISFALGFNLLIFFIGITGTVVRALIGIAYVIVAGYIMKHSLSYHKTMKDTHLVCQHCAQKKA